MVQRSSANRIGDKGVGRMSHEELLAERARLKARLDWLGVRSTGSERIENRILHIERQLGVKESILRHLFG